MTEQHDIVVIGGGLVGSSLAIALDRAGRRVALVEAQTAPPATVASYGERNLALARASRNGLAAIGVWPRVATQSTPIQRIHVSRAGEFGSLRMRAEDAGVDALGFTLPARELGAALAAGVAECRQLEHIVPARLTALSWQGGVWRLQLALADGGQRDLTARLVVGADGSESMVRHELGIAVDRHDYAQTLFVATVQPRRPLAGQAHERFSDAGPVALLPLAGERAGLVLTVANADADAVAALSDAEFLRLAMRRLGARPGGLLRPGPRHRHPVARVVARHIVGPRAVLVGNAAQTVHPIGAQGFNLGLRDALTLAELVIDAADPGAAELLARYADRRAPDREGVMAFSHGLVRLACLAEPSLAPLRSLALLGLGLPPWRRELARRGMGYRGTPPRAVLERGP
ncbi:MAG TPA: FAD-dependent monooxygenase [Rhodanobacteraceae bacterium]|nr:FAD-dependent monooxygenase [Rhodanobacteraceae bacterium]